MGASKVGLDRSKTGRKKGTPNKTTALLRDAVLLAADEAGGEGGLVGYLKLQAVENPGPFMTLLGKVLPTQVQAELTGKDGAPIQTEEMSARELLTRRIAGLAARTGAPASAK